MSLMDRIRHLAVVPQTSVSLKHMVNFGKLSTPTTIMFASQFMRDELPIRLAHRVVELESLPHHLSEMPSVQKVKQWYIQSFDDLVNFPTPSSFGVPDGAYTQKAPPLLKTGNTEQGFIPPNQNIPFVSPEVQNYNKSFMECIEKIKRRHDPVVTTMAQGIVEVKELWRKTNTSLISSSKNRNNFHLPVSIQAFLDRFYMSRIGIRMLIGQHVALTKSSISTTDKRSDYVGIICTKTSVRKVVQEAVDNARFICSDYYGLIDAPKVRLILQEADLEFMYVPSHLQHMLFELLKNSLRAVVERHGLDCETYPEIKMIVASGKEDITIKVSDEGGGIPRSGTNLIWTYMYSTAETPSLEEDYNKSDFKAPLAGFGYGLPLSRLYARYFGGDLKLISMEGYEELTAVLISCGANIATDITNLLTSLRALFGFKKLIFEKANRLIVCFASPHHATLAYSDLIAINGSRFIRVSAPHFIKLQLALFLKSLPLTQSIWFCQINPTCIIVALRDIESAVDLTGILMKTNFEIDTQDIDKCECSTCVDKLSEPESESSVNLYEQQRQYKRRNHNQPRYNRLSQNGFEVYQQEPQWGSAQTQVAPNSVQHQHADWSPQGLNSAQQQYHRSQIPIENQCYQNTVELSSNLLPNLGQTKKNKSKYKPPPLPRYDDMPSVIDKVTLILTLINVSFTSFFRIP
ncbi:hypothetical protein HK096_003964 [Nowakowskiella sp. JEL0078]|nr:hypothetical protein HK096_003964 [Nowakowskiella sp. JEL0078]